MTNKKYYVLSSNKIRPSGFVDGRKYKMRLKTSRGVDKEIFLITQRRNKTILYKNLMQVYHRRIMLSTKLVCFTKITLGVWFY